MSIDRTSPHYQQDRLAFAARFSRNYPGNREQEVRNAELRDSARRGNRYAQDVYQGLCRDRIATETAVGQSAEASARRYQVAAGVLQGTADTFCPGAPEALRDTAQALQQRDLRKAAWGATRGAGCYGLGVARQWLPGKLCQGLAQGGVVVSAALKAPRLAAGAQVTGKILHTAHDLATLQDYKRNLARSIRGH